MKPRRPRALLQFPVPSRTLWIDRPACTGCNVCVEMCPEVFELDEDAVAIISNSRGDTEEAIGDAIDACPESCIHWRD